MARVMNFDPADGPQAAHELPLTSLSFVSLWALASAVGGLAFEAVASLNVPLAAAALGVLLGLPQWVVLRVYLPQALRWIGVTTAAVLLAWIVGAFAMLLVFIVASPLFPLLAMLLPPDIAGFILFGAIAGAATLIAGGAVGAIQSGLLLRDGLPRRVWAWPSACGVLGFWLVLIGLHLPFGGLAATDPLVHLGSGVLGGITYGLLTGPALERLVNSLASPAKRTATTAWRCALVAWR